MKKYPNGGSKAPRRNTPRVKKQRHVAIPGDADILRSCIMCDSADDARVTYECIQIVTNDLVFWEIPEYGNIWKVVREFASKYKEAPDIRVIRKALSESDVDSESALNEVEHIIHRKRYTPGNLRMHLDACYTKAQQVAWVVAMKEAAQIIRSGMEVGGQWWVGAERSARYEAQQKERIFGSQAAARQKPLDPNEPDWPVMIVGQHGKVPAPGRVENTKAMLEHHGISVRYNVMKGRREIDVPGLSTCTDTEANKALAYVHELAVKHRLKPTAEAVERHLTLLQDHYHPVAEWITSKPWDGTERVAQALQTLWIDSSYGDGGTLEDQQHIANILCCWLTTAVKAALVPLDAPGGRGIAAQGMLVFTGLQGKGKTRWFRALVPPNEDWFGEAIRLDPDNRDSVATATGRWIVELGELDATFRKADLAALKGFITSPEDTYRSPYERAAEDHPRRTVFCGTVNDPRYLRDETGNRRFWTIPISRIDPDALAQIDLQQFWAEVAAWVASGEKHWLTKETEEWLGRWNQQYEDVPPAVEAFVGTWEPDPFSRARIDNDEIRRSLVDTYRNMGRQEMQSITSYMRRVWNLTPHRAKGLDRWAIKRRMPVSLDGKGTIIDATNRFASGVPDSNEDADKSFEG